MTAHDYLAEAEAAATIVTLEQFDQLSAMALLSIGQQLRRIADLMERPLEPVTAELVETDPVPLVAKLRQIIAEQRRALGGVVPEPEPEPLDPVTGTNVPAYVNDADYGADRVSAYLAREGRL